MVDLIDYARNPLLELFFILRYCDFSNRPKRLTGSNFCGETHSHSAISNSRIP